MDSDAVALEFLRKICVFEKKVINLQSEMRTWRNGSRARLRIWCLTTWGFESLRAHNFQPGAIRFPAVLTLYRILLPMQA